MKISQKKIEILRAENGIKVKDLSLKAGVSIVTLQRIAKKQEADAITVGKIAKALNVPVIDLIED